MSGFTKLFSSIVSSSIWQEPDHVRLVWITMLALANADGHVDCSTVGLAHLARVDKDKCAEALNVLASPDPDSRSKTNDGRRIEEAEGGGWNILNYVSYRVKGSVNPSERALYQRGYHQARRGGKPTSDDPSYMRGFESFGSNGGKTVHERFNEADAAEVKEKKEAKKTGKKPPRRTGFKAWTEAQLIRDVETCNGDALLDAVEMDDFIKYWTERSSSGRMKFTFERTWDTRRRMQTLRRIIDERQQRGGKRYGGQSGRRGDATDDPNFGKFDFTGEGDG